MAGSKVIVLTGASRGIGLAIAHYLLKQSHKVVIVARTAEPLHELRRQYPNQVETMSVDLSDFSEIHVTLVAGNATYLPNRLDISSASPMSRLVAADRIVSLALNSFSRIDGLILNHGLLGAVTKLADSNLADWRQVYDVNFFSCVAFIKAALPSLRSTNGRVILTSSGAAAGAYSTWGAYGSSKAAMNHLAMTLEAEEPLVTTLAIRPGVVDTDMQRAIREEHVKVMDSKDQEKFSGLHKDGKLLRAEQPGNVIAKLVLEAPKSLGGQFLSWNDEKLGKFQEQ